jgi:seryl-tRNA synthetase
MIKPGTYASADEFKHIKDEFRITNHTVDELQHKFESKIEEITQNFKSSHQKIDMIEAEVTALISKSTQPIREIQLEVGRNKILV